MKNGIALMCLALAPVLAHGIIIENRDPFEVSPVAVVCTPEIPFIGQVTQVTVERGVTNLPATLDYGTSWSGSQVYDYQVNMTESKDLKIRTYRGPGFVLVINVETKSARLNADIYGEPLESGNNMRTVTLTNLRCEINDFIRHGGVSMSNFEPSPKDP